jgi:outer membrane protein assembly factor BamB
VVFCQNSRLIERYRDEIARAPEQASNYYRLARAAEAVGQDDLALDSYRGAIGRARPNDLVGGIALADAAGEHVFRLLVRLAGHSRRGHRYDEAIARLEAAAGSARSDSDRLESQLLLADLQLDAARPATAAATLQQILLDGRARALPVAAADGRRTIRADLLIADRLGGIVRNHGRGVYESFDRQAAALYERGKAERDVHVLGEVCRDYPIAQVVPDALFELATLHESTGRLAEASQTYKRLLSLATDDEHRALAIWSLARVYHARKLFVSARDAYLDLQARYPRLRLDRAGLSMEVADLVAEKLDREPYCRLVADRPQPPLPRPLVRRWQWQAENGRPIRAIGAEGTAPTLDASRVLLGQGDVLRALDPADGTIRWSIALGAPPVWAAYLADKLIAATPRHIVALELAHGTEQWRFAAAAQGKPSSRVDPFAVPKETDERPERSGIALHGFRVVKGRVFALRGQSEIVAIDGDSGALDWSFSAPPAEINPNLWVGPDRIVLQLDRPNHLLVLRTDDGQPVARAALAEKDVLERAPLPVDDDTVLVVPDARTVKKLDLNSGQTVWEYRESEEQPANGHPCVFGDAERLLVLHGGRLLTRVDAATGSRRWSCLLGTEDLSKRAGSLVFDDERVYCVYRWSSTVTLRSVSMANGTPAWTRHWTGPENAAWSIALAAHHVLAYPVSSGTGDAGDGETSTVIENVPLIVMRRESGALVERFVFGATIANVTLRIDPAGALVATPRGVWGLGARD